MLFSIPISNGLCTSNCSACALEYSPPFTVVYNASNARPDLRGQTFTIQSSDSSVISNSVSKYFIIQGGILRINNATNFSRNDIALNVFGNTILPVTYHFTVFAAFPTVYSILVCVQGQDNNTPTFPRSEVLIPVLEGTFLSWPMDLAADNDEGENSTQNYSILSNDPSVNSDLYLDIARNRDNKITSILLISTVPLDPGRKASYNFTMVAQEGRPNTTKGYQKVYVIVQYLCNSVPIFEMSTYQISLPLSTAINVSVVMIKALHISSQNTAPIYYSIASACAIGQSIRCSSSSASTNFGPFALDSRSGNLTLTSALDYNQAHQFNITLVATDACNLVGSALVLVQITLIPPSIQVIVSNNGMFREDYSLTSDVATVIVSDPDHLNVSVIVLDNATGLMSDTFYLVGLGSSYRLRLLHTLDSKVKSSYYITIQASDPANNVVYFTFNVTIVGINHPPIFENKTVFINIPYNTGNGMRLLHVHASDIDFGGNGAVTYELPPPNATFPYQNFFKVNNTNGDILITGILDKTVAESFPLLIMARDNPTGGESYLCDFMIVNVSLINIDLSKASFQLQSSKIRISDSFSRETMIVSRTVPLHSISNTEILPALSTQAILPVYSTQTDQANPSIQLPVTIIIIVATLAAVIILILCMAVFIVAFCFHHTKQKCKVTIAINPCDQLELQHAHYEPSNADIHCNDIIFVSSTQEKNGLQHSLIKQGEGAPPADKVRAIQSTSDLASTISTDMIADSESTGPYSKVQLMAIYAANAQLLNNMGSQNSMHMFGSEGGIEVDEVDMNNLSFDEDEDADSVQMNDAIISSVTNSNANVPTNDMTYKYRTVLHPVVRPVINKQLYLATSSDTMDGAYNMMAYQHASQQLLPRRHEHWEQQCCTHDHEYSSDTRLNIEQKHMKRSRCGSTSMANHHDNQQNRKYSTPACKMIPGIIQPHPPVSFSSPDHPYSSGFFCTTRFPTTAVSSHGYARSATPHSANETDNSTLSSIQTNRAPEHYYSNFSLGSTSLSQPVP